MSKKYQVIYADPPWPEKGHYKTTKGAKDHYNLMTWKELEKLPVHDIVSPDGCVLFLWCPYRHLPKALTVLDIWGFEYKTIGFVWVKVTKHKPTRLIYGPGYYTGSNTEPCFIATSGRVPIPEIDGNKQVVIEPRRAHSQKPDEIAKRIEQMYKSLSKIELFARKKRKGWQVWGDEVKSDTRL